MSTTQPLGTLKTSLHNKEIPRYMTPTRNPRRTHSATTTTTNTRTRKAVTVQPKKTRAATAPVDDDDAIKSTDCNQETMDETVTLSPISAPLTPRIDASPPLITSRSVACGTEESGTAAVRKKEEKEKDVKEDLSLTCAPPVESGAHVDTTGAGAAIDVDWNKQMLYYLEAARALRQVNSGAEAKEEFVEKEIQRESEVAEKKKKELAEKQKRYRELHDSTLRLTRQVRSLDGENDRMRDHLAQLHATIDKLQSRRVPRRLHRELGLTATTQEATRKQLSMRNASSSAAAVNIPPTQHSNVIAHDSLMAELNLYNRKLRFAESQHEELIKELQLVAARKKGRAAAYSIVTTSFNTSGYEGRPKRGSSHFTDSVEDISVIQQLEQMVNDSFVRCL